MSYNYDHHKHLILPVSADDVAAVANRIEQQQYASTDFRVIQQIIYNAGADFDGAISSLNQDGLQRAYFELRLLEAGARVTYDRLQDSSRLNPSLEELEDLVDCVNVFETSGAIKNMIDNVREKTGVHGARLGDLGGIGFDLVYNELIRVIVNVGERL